MAFACTIFLTFWAFVGTILTYIQCHQSSFRSYAPSECWRCGSYTLPGLCSSEWQCGVWSLSGQGLSKSAFVEGQLLPTAALRRCWLQRRRTIKVSVLYCFNNQKQQFVFIPPGSMSQHVDVSYDNWSAGDCAAPLTRSLSLWGVVMESTHLFLLLHVAASLSKWTH